MADDGTPVVDEREKLEEVTAALLVLG